MIPSDIPTFEELGLPPVANGWLVNLEVSCYSPARPAPASRRPSPRSSITSTHAGGAHPHHRGPDRVRCTRRRRSPSARSARDSLSFERALRSALREDPDVLLVGEMRDLETIELALDAAETGHLVFSTLHTNDAKQAIDRIIDVFPAWRQDQIRVQLGIVSAVIAQRWSQRLAAAWWPLSRC